ncbi:MAG: sodium:proton antiporter, partial [Sulfurovaceae bacterium]
MATKEEILEALKNVIYPGFTKDIVTFDFIKDVVAQGEKAS